MQELTEKTAQSEAELREHVERAFLHVYAQPEYAADLPPPSPPPPAGAKGSASAAPPPLLPVRRCTVPGFI